MNSKVMSRGIAVGMIAGFIVAVIYGASLIGFALCLLIGAAIGGVVASRWSGSANEGGSNISDAKDNTTTASNV